MQLPYGNRTIICKLFVKEAAAAEMAKMGFQLRPGAQKPGDWHLRF